MNKPQVTDKVVIVTGAAGGIGQALVHKFASSGMRVGAIDKTDMVLKLQSELGADRVHSLVGDVSDAKNCIDTTDAVRHRFGKVDALVNNAALGMQLISKDCLNEVLQIESISADVFQNFINVNLCGPFFMTKAVMPYFRKQNSGRIINVTTSFMTMLRPGFAPYGASMSGLEAWTTMLAGELKGSGITANVVIPGGPADTAMIPMETKIDRSQLVRPEQLADPMLWLFTEEASETTGMRFVAAKWNKDLPGADAARGCGAPAAWPEMTAGFVGPEKLQVPV